MTANIEHFLRGKSHVLRVTVENFRDDFSSFWDWIDAQGDKEAALVELDTRYNDSESTQGAIPPGMPEAANTPIGEGGVESLLVGGSRPTLTLIPKSSAVQAGDVVYLATQDLPYGLAVGSVREVRMASDGLLQEATMDFPYDLNQIRTVLILP